MKKAKQLTMTFDKAVIFLRQGEMLRRIGWTLHTSYIVRAGNTVVVFFGYDQKEESRRWYPWPMDILAKDWVVFKGDSK